MYTDFVGNVPLTHFEFMRVFTVILLYITTQLAYCITIHAYSFVTSTLFIMTREIHFKMQVCVWYYGLGRVFVNTSSCIVILKRVIKGIKRYKKNRSICVNGYS